MELRPEVEAGKSMAKTQAFDLYSNQYDHWFDKNPQFYEAELEAVRQLMPHSSSNGLEVGVGSGKFAGPLGVGTGVEPSPQMAEQAIRLGIDVRKGVAEALPFPDNSFSYILMVTTICFVDDIEQSFLEAYRVLQSGGCIIVGFVDKESVIGKNYLERKNESRFYQDATFYSAEEILRYLQAAGFSQIITKQTLFPGDLMAAVQDGHGAGSFVVIKAAKPEL